ncbi:Transcriptional regulatory protein BaeR [compost metagenome]
MPVARPRRVREAPLPAHARVLIVDDRQSHRAVLRGFLSPLGLAVQEVGEGAAVLPQVRAWHPQLVLLDLNLPDASGWDLCREIRALADAPQVVIVSANAHENTEEARLLHGYLGFVSKPVRESELIDMVRHALTLPAEPAESAESAESAEPPQSPEPEAPPHAELLREMLQLGATGRLRALEAQLAELAASGGAIGAWARQMLTLARTDGAALNDRLGEALHASRT